MIRALPAVRAMATYSHFTVRIRVPGEAPRLVTTISRGPASAVSGVLNHLIRDYPAHVLKETRLSCRSGWWLQRGDNLVRIDPLNNRASAMALGGLL